MSHISASEKPAPAATPLTAAITGIGDAAEVDDRLVQHVGAAAHVGRQVGAGLLEPAPEPGHVAARPRTRGPRR